MSIELTGTITIDGEKSEFSADSEDSWFQWGATESRLFLTVSLVEAIHNAVFEASTE